jgi:hypothetical protein
MSFRELYRRLVVFGPGGAFKRSESVGPLACEADSSNA